MPRPQSHAGRQSATTGARHKETTLARAKNIGRAEARRRAREAARAELAVETGELDEEADVVVAEAPRKPLFKSPRVRQDLRALPQMFASRRLLWVPLVLLLVGFALVYATPGLQADVAGIASLFVQFFFLPPALFTFFVAGYLAPRSSYLVGLLYGLIAAVLWIPAFGLALPGAEGEPVQPAGEPLSAAAVVLFYGAVFGTLAAAFAGWYRDFLKGMREKGAQRRAEREQEERAKRRQSRREARRPSG